jgi:hypothetical protein
VEETFRWLRLDEGARAFAALRAFHIAAGPHMRERARAERMRGSTLYVRVVSSAWSQELHALKAQLLAKLRRTPGGEGIDDLRFTVGPLHELPSWEQTPSRRAAEPPAPRVSDDLARAMGEVGDDELREQLTRLYARLGSRSRP